jgi:hypothetical protein
MQQAVTIPCKDRENYKFPLLEGCGPLGMGTRGQASTARTVQRGGRIGPEGGDEPDARGGGMAAPTSISLTGLEGRRAD